MNPNIYPRLGFVTFRVLSIPFSMLFSMLLMTAILASTSTFGKNAAGGRQQGDNTN
jgi:hypothetical protein